MLVSSWGYTPFFTHNTALNSDLADDLSWWNS